MCEIVSTLLDLHVGEMYISHTEVKPGALSLKRQKENKKKCKTITITTVQEKKIPASYYLLITVIG